jgi:hypothetical protein
MNDSNKDDTPGMCLAVVVVLSMLVMGRGSATAMVEEAVTVAAEEADEAPCSLMVLVGAFILL